MAVSGQFKFVAALSKELTLSGRNQVIRVGPDDTEYNFGPGTDPDATAVFSEVIALSSGEISVDLTALAQSGGLSALDLSGKTIYGVKIKNLGANTMTFSQGATNGYPMFSLTPGQPVQSLGELMQVAPVVGFATVAGADKTIDVAGTGAQTFRLTIWAGTSLMSLKVSAKPGKGRSLSDVVKDYGVQVQGATDEQIGKAANRYMRYTAIGWPVDTGYSRGTITAPERLGPGHYQFRITADYAWVIEHGGYRGVGPKTHEEGGASLPGDVNINTGIYVTQRPSAPLRRAKSKVKLELAQLLAPALLRKSGFKGFAGGGTSGAFRSR